MPATQQRAGSLTASAPGLSAPTLRGKGGVGDISEGAVATTHPYSPSGAEWLHSQETRAEERGDSRLALVHPLVGADLPPAHSRSVGMILIPHRLAHLLRRKKKKNRGHKNEADHITLKPFPHFKDFVAWRYSVRTAVAAAFGRGG